MLIIPLRQQDSTVRRLPWISAALIALNVVVFLATSIGSSGLESDVRRQARAVADVVLERPYLSLHPTVADLFDITPEDLEEARAEIDPLRVPRGAALEREQADLNRMCDALLQALARLPIRRFGFVPAAPRAETLLTSMFIHAGLLHLLGNMLFLYLSGPFVEDVFGRALFAVLYLLSGIAAAAAQAVSDPGSTLPMVGASGAVAGVMGAFLMRLTRARIELLVLPILFLPTLRFNVVLPAFVVLPLWAAEQYWYAQTAPEAGVAWWAHIGGFLFGMAAALAIRLSGIEASWIHPGIEKRISVTQHGGLERALDARLAGDVARARREIGLVLRDQPDSLDGWRESLEIALEARDDAETGRSATRLLDLLARAGEEDLALELIGDDRLRARHPPARFWLTAAGLLERAGDARGALDLYSRAADAAPDDVAGLRGLVKRGEILARGGNVREAREAYTRAQAHPACQGSWAGQVERALKDLGSRG